MEKATMLIALLLVTGMLASGRSHAAEAVEHWVTHNLDKVFPDTVRPDSAPTAIQLKAARNETEDAQIVVRIPKGTEIAKAAYVLDDLVGPDGARIPAASITARWVWYTFVLNNPPANTDPSTYLRKAPAFFPDGFLEQTAIRIRDEWTQPLWVSVTVPKDQTPGEYRGKIAVELVDTKGVTQRIETPVTLVVWAFSLPEEPTLHHTEWFSYDVLASYYRIEPWSERHWEWIARVAADMGQHKQDTILTPFTALVKMTKNSSGGFDYDFSGLDRWVETFRKAGVTWIEGGHAAGRGGGWESDFVWARFPVLDSSGKSVVDGLSEEEFEPYVKAFLQAIHAHLKERGWADRYFQHIADEPIPVNEKSWEHRAKRVREWLPGIPVIDAIMSEGLKDCIDIRVPQIQHIKPAGERKKTDTYWSYVCLYPQGKYPNRFLDYSSIRNRILFWLSYSLDLKGFLHWGYNYWQTWSGVSVPVDISPWTDASGASVYCADRQPLPAGDPFIVYPGRAQICGSIRWEVVRKGMEDFEYLHMLDQAVNHAKHKPPKAIVKRGRALLKTIETEIAAAPDNHTHDDARLLAVREQIGELLSRMATVK